MVLRRAALPFTLSLAAHVSIAVALVHPRAEPAAYEREPGAEIAGETFELPAPDSVEVPLANATPTPAFGAHAGADEPTEADGVLPATPKVPGRPAPKKSRPTRPSAGHAVPEKVEASGSGNSALFGAVGDRSATDLTKTFTRLFSDVGSSDPAWRSAPIGAAGEADVVLTLDASGQIADKQILGAPSPALASTIRRVFVALGKRPFVARGKTTKLHVVATISPDTVHDGLHGDVFALGASADGSAFFALNIGRRVDLVVRAR